MLAWYVGLIYNVDDVASDYGPRGAGGEKVQGSGETGLRWTRDARLDRYLRGPIIKGIQALGSLIEYEGLQIRNALLGDVQTRRLSSTRAGEIRASRASTAALAARYGVSPRTVRAIKQGTRHGPS